MTKDDIEHAPWNSELQNLVNDRQRELEGELVGLLKEAAEAKDFAKRYENTGMPSELTSAAQVKAVQHLSRVQQIESELRVYDRLFARTGERVKGWLGVAGFAISLVTLLWRMLGGH